MSWRSFWWQNDGNDDDSKSGNKSNGSNSDRRSGDDRRQGSGSGSDSNDKPGAAGSGSSSGSAADSGGEGGSGSGRGRGGSGSGSGGDSDGEESGSGGSSDSEERRPSLVVVGEPKNTDITALAQGDNAPRPPQVIALPITRKPLFPGFMVPLTITDEAMIEALTGLKRSLKPYLGVFMAKEANEEGGEAIPLRDIGDVHRVGTLAHLAHQVPLPGGIQVMLMGHRRVSIVGAAEGTSPLEAKVIHHDPPPFDPSEEDVLKAYTHEILSTLKDVIKINNVFKEHVQYFTQRLDVQDMYKLADFAAALTSAGALELQVVLEAPTLMERMKGALTLLKKELEISKLQQEINKQVEEKMAKNQRQYFLQEQLKQIKKELGMEKDDKEALLQKFKERVSCCGGLGLLGLLKARREWRAQTQW